MGIIQKAFMFLFYHSLVQTKSPRLKDFAAYALLPWQLSLLITMTLSLENCLPLAKLHKYFSAGVAIWKASSSELDSTRSSSLLLSDLQTFPTVNYISSQLSMDKHVAIPSFVLLPIMLLDGSYRHLLSVIM